MTELNADNIEAAVTADPDLLMLASLLCSYPSVELGANLSEILKDDALLQEATRIAPGPWGTVLSFLRACASQPERLEDWRSEYVDLFDRSPESSPLYETEYGRARALAKGNQLSDISGFYKAFGFDLSDQAETKEMADHLAVELEFYALLGMKEFHFREQGNVEAFDIVHSARRRFLEDHLGTYLGAVLKRPGMQRSPFFFALISWVTQMIEGDIAAYGVKPKRVEWATGEDADESMCCGGDLLSGSGCSPRAQDSKGI